MIMRYFEAIQSVDVGYDYEAAAYFTAGIIFCILGCISVYARHFDWNRSAKNAILVRYTQFCVVSTGLLMTAWNVDPRGLYGVYSLWVLISLKDSITLLLASNGLVYVHILHKVALEAKWKDSTRSKLDKIWLSVILPLVFLCAVQMSSSYLAIRYNREIYRTAFFGLLMLIIVISALVAMSIYRMISKSQKATGKGARRPKDSMSKMRKKLGRTIVLLTMCSCLQAYLTIQTYLNDGSLTSAQIPDPNNYQPIYWVPFVDCLLMTVALMHAWLPCRETEKMMTKRIKTVRRLMKMQSMKMDEVKPVRLDAGESPIEDAEVDELQIGASSVSTSSSVASPQRPSLPLEGSPPPPVPVTKTFD